MTPPSFTHYLLTRFNLRKETWKTSRNGTPVLTDSWLENRFNLFEQFCFPSVCSQINKNFEWLVFFDKTTSDRDREKIKSYQQTLPNFKPLFLDGMKEFRPAIKQVIAESPTDFIITSRLDNDDCIHENFINTIQNNFDGQHFMALDFPEGFTLQTEPEIRLGKRRQNFNPFLTLIERNKNPQGIFSKHNHGTWKEERNVKRLLNQRIWMSIIHPENKKNEFMGYGEIDFDTAFEGFIIDKKTKAEVKAKLVEVSSWKLTSLNNRVKTYRKVLNKDIKRKLGLYY